MNRIKVIWQVLTSNNWLLINTEPSDRPFTLMLPYDIEITYHASPKTKLTKESE